MYNKVNSGRLRRTILNFLELIFFQSIFLLSLVPHILFYSYCNGLASWHDFPDITHTKGNNGHQSAILNFIELNIFRANHSLKSHILSYRNGLAIWHGVPDIMHITCIKVNSDHKLTILNWIECNFFMAYPSLKPQHFVLY